MKRKTVSVLLGVALLAVTGLPATGAQADGRWIHIRVLDRSEREESVRINLPVGILETLAASIEADQMKDGRVRLGETGLKPDQIRAMWQALRSSGDMEYVTIESANETVRVARSGNYMLARIRGAGEGDKSREKVDVKVPLNVVDALLDAPEGELNLKGALQRLAEHDAGDLVTIQGGDSDVRIWIDSRSAAEDE